MKRNGDCANQSDWSRALEAAEKLIKRKPNVAAYVAGRGQALFELNRFAEADSDFLKAFAIAGRQTPFIQYFEGKISIARGDRKQATAFFSAAAIDPNDPNHSKYQTVSDLAKDVSKTDQDVREKHSSVTCRAAYQIDKESSAKDDTTILMSFIKQNDMAGLRKVLPCRFDLNKQNSKGATALVCASLLFSEPSFVIQLFKTGQTQILLLRQPVLRQ